MKATVIFNPSAGRGRGGAIAARVQSCLARHGLDIELHATQHPKEAETIAARSATQTDIIVAVGGDGTVNEVVNGMTGSGALLGIVPAGTVNVLALELNLPVRVEQACDVIAGGRTVTLDVGQANDRRFILMMGAGIDALTIHNLDLRAKKRFKELAFVSTGLRAGLAHRPPAFSVTVDGKRHEVTFFVAGNSRYYGGRFGITTNANPADGLLDLLLFKGTSVASLAVFWLGVPSGLHLRHRDVICIQAQRAELAPLDEACVVWFQTDGELAGTLPATVAIQPRAIRVLVP